MSKFASPSADVAEAVRKSRRGRDEGEICANHLAS